MDTLTTDNDKLKDLFKQAIIEAMEEKKDVVHDLLLEVMEDLAMIHAIQEGEDLVPGLESTVGRDDDRPLFVAPADHLVE